MAEGRELGRGGVLRRKDLKTEKLWIETHLSLNSNFNNGSFQLGKLKNNVV